MTKTSCNVFLHVYHPMKGQSTAAVGEASIIIDKYIYAQNQQDVNIVSKSGKPTYEFRNVRTSWFLKRYLVLFCQANPIRTPKELSGEFNTSGHSYLNATISYSADAAWFCAMLMLM